MTDGKTLTSLFQDLDLTFTKEKTEKGSDVPRLTTYRIKGTTKNNFKMLWIIILVISVFLLIGLASLKADDSSPWIWRKIQASFYWFYDNFVYKLWFEMVTVTVSSLALLIGYKRLCYHTAD